MVIVDILSVFAILCVVLGVVVDYYIFHAFTLNYLLIGMAFSASVANLVDEEKLEKNDEKLCTNN